MKIKITFYNKETTLLNVKTVKYNTVLDILTVTFTNNTRSEEFGKVLFFIIEQNN